MNAPRKPTDPRAVSRWLALLPAEQLLPEARAIADELALWKGRGHSIQRGALHMMLPLGDGEALVEYEYSAPVAGRLSGPPENCFPDEPEEIGLLQVLLNGVWCDCDLISEEVRDRWIQQISDEAEETRRESFEEPEEAF